MTEAGDQHVGTASETLARLRENPALMSETVFPAAGYTLCMGYETEDNSYTVRVHQFGTEPTPETVYVFETGLTEEEVIFRMGVLQTRERMAQENVDPFEMMIRQMLAGMDD